MDGLVRGQWVRETTTESEAVNGRDEALAATRNLIALGLIHSTAIV
jgi:hypothetical protein